tara:strand:+ start:67562 stop:68737 length:1176 start_codon:yes stop_codon:yes gene_type:complete
MRIGIVLSQTPGYSETFFTSKIKGLQAQGFTVQLFVQKREANFTLCPVRLAPKVSRFVPFQLLKMIWVYILLVPYIGRVLKFSSLERAEGTSPGSLLKKIFLNAHLLKANLDWVHFGFATQALGSECVAKAIGAKMAVSFRGFDLNIYPLKHNGCYDKTWNHVAKVHSISHYLYKKGVDLGLSEKIPHAIITPAVDMALIPKSTAVVSKKLQVTTIARLNWIKGITTAITAMALLKKKGIPFQYHIVGDGTVKDTERYMFQVYELGLQEDVSFHGTLTHAETLQRLQETDVYVQPSVNEGFCNAVLEAQALGTLVVASDVGGLPENLVDGKTGWLFPVEDAPALAERIATIIEMPVEQQEHVKELAKKRVATHFTIEKQQREFELFYTEML